MKRIRTVCGDIPAQSLGHCQCHEHLFIAKGQSFLVNPALWMDSVDAALGEALLYQAAGGDALVDAQPVGAGRMAKALLEVSRKTGVKIIASTGFHKTCFYAPEHWIHGSSEDALADYFIADIERGMSVDADNEQPNARCEARAGIVKCALDENGLDDGAKKRFAAAAAAASATGAPVMIHTEDGLHSLQAIEFLGKRIPPSQVIICHMERSLRRMEEKLDVARSGVFIQCDTIARSKYHSDEDEAVFLRELCENGHVGQILLGLDTTRQRLKSYGGETGLDYIRTSFLPMLQKHGFALEDLQKFCITNPQAALALRKQEEK